MKAIRLALVLALLSLAPAARATPPVVTHGAGALATVTSDGAAEYGWDTQSKSAEIEITNIGSHAVTIKLTTATVVNTDPANPVSADGEYVLPAGGVLLLGRGSTIFYHQAGSGAGTFLSIVLRH